jgi:hypothetical protein
MLVQLADVGVEDLIGLLRVLNLYAAELAVEHATEADIARVRAAVRFPGGDGGAARGDQLPAQVDPVLGRLGFGDFGLPAGGGRSRRRAVGGTVSFLVPLVPRSLGLSRALGLLSAREL